MASSKYYSGSDSGNTEYNSGVGKIYYTPNNSTGDDSVKFMSSNNLSRTSRSKTIAITPSLPEASGLTQNVLITQDNSNALIRACAILEKGSEPGSVYIKTLSTTTDSVHSSDYDVSHIIGTSVEKGDVKVIVLTNGNVISAELRKVGEYGDLFNRTSFNSGATYQYAVVPEQYNSQSNINIPIHYNSTNSEDEYQIYPVRKFNIYDVTDGSAGSEFINSNFSSNLFTFDTININASGVVSVSGTTHNLKTETDDYGKYNGLVAVMFSLGTPDLSDATNLSLLVVRTSVVDNSNVVDTNYTDDVYDGCAELSMIFHAEDENNLYLSVSPSGLTFQEDGTINNSHVGLVEVDSNISWHINNEIWP